MKHIKEYNGFFNLNESGGGLRQDAIELLDRCAKKRWRLDHRGYVDVRGDFICTVPRTEFSSGLTSLKGIRFGRVTGDFNVDNNSLSTMNGFPEEVGGNLVASYNKIKSLKGGPKKVGFNYAVTGNKLTSLEGAPESINGSFSCSYNKLSTLKNGPMSVEGSFICTGNLLENLVGSPKVVGEDLFVSDNDLRTLDGAPNTIGGRLVADNDKTGVYLEVDYGMWNFEGLLKTLARLENEGEHKASNLLLTYLTHNKITDEIRKNPVETMLLLKKVWGDPVFDKMRDKVHLPRGFRDEMDLLGDLDNIGL